MQKGLRIKDEVGTTNVDAHVSNTKSREKYCTPVMFACFVCALLSFRAHEFPAKSEKNPGHLSLTKGRIGGVIYE